MDLLYKSADVIGCFRFLWECGRSRLRILCYHGVCDDSVASQPWMPSFFVTRSAFEEQLAFLSRSASVLPLAEAARRLRMGSLPPRAVSITFDDGYANNMRVASPLLRRYGVPATVFLSTANVESGDFYPFLKLKLISLDGTPRTLPDYNTSPLDLTNEGIRSWWPEVEAALSAEARETLRPMSVDDVRAADPSLLSFGAHCHNHCILKNESAARREQELRTSLRKVADWTGHPTKLFSYPNGQRGDFGQSDKAILRAEGVEAAVSGLAGSNRLGQDPLELRRYPLTLGHTKHRFFAEITGFRATLLGAAARIRP